jgi:hypothetical protein
MRPLRKHAFTISLLLSLLTFFGFLLPQTAAARATNPQGLGPEVINPTEDLTSAKVHGYFFYANTCSHCLDILTNILEPLQTENPGQIDMRCLNLGIRTTTALSWPWKKPIR